MPLPLESLVGRIHQHNALSLSTLIEPGSVDLAITSTAYFGKRAYSDDYASVEHDDEMGRHSLDEYISDQVALGTEIAKALSPRGSYWLNVDTTASNSGGAGGDHVRSGSKTHIARYRQGATGIRGHQDLLVPQRLALALQGAGWLVRKVIIWDKGQLKPESAAHVRRPRSQYETIFMLARSGNYFYDHEAEVEHGDVWHFGAYRGPRRGPAPFPRELPERIIRVASRPGDVVLDPCGGSMMTCQVAEDLERRWIGVDLYDTGAEVIPRAATEETA
jgi:DNA modification methylase